MIYFPEIRARRFTIQLRELTIGQSLELAARPVHLEQSNTTLFLRHAVVNPKIPVDRWRIGERVLAVAHYLSCVTQEPNFKIGQGSYADYLVSEAAQIPDGVDLGTVVGESWRMRHLDGRLAEAIERLSVPPLAGRLMWLMGTMAAQMYRPGELEPDTMTEGTLDEWLEARVQAFGQISESEFEEMLLAFHKGREQLTHLFRIDVDDSGIVCRANKEDAGLPPARFPVRANLSAWTRAMAGRAD